MKNGYSSSVSKVLPPVGVLGQDLLTLPAYQWKSLWRKASAEYINTLLCVQHTQLNTQYVGLIRVHSNSSLAQGATSVGDGVAVHNTMETVSTSTGRQNFCRGEGTCSRNENLWAC